MSHIFDSDSIPPIEPLSLTDFVSLDRVLRNYLSLCRVLAANYPSDSAPALFYTRMAESVQESLDDLRSHYVLSLGTDHALL